MVARLAAAAGAVLLVSAAMPLVAITARLAHTRVSAADRFLIWKDTIPMLRDFWLTGTGAGTYETGMLVYQRASPGVRFNQAHNHYLQLAAEGGVWLCLPLAISLLLYAKEAWRRVAAETSAMYWVRAGALCGLAGAAAQSVWETGLAIPANAALACVLAAIVIHEPRTALTWRCASGIDIDSVLADFRTAFHAAAVRCLRHDVDDAQDLETTTPLSLVRCGASGSRTSPRAQNWWMEVPPYEPDQIARLYSLTRAIGWEVFFMTKRPPSGGDSVQFQTQLWIERFGFYLPRC